MNDFDYETDFDGAIALTCADALLNRALDMAAFYSGDFDRIVDLSKALSLLTIADSLLRRGTA